MTKYDALKGQALVEVGEGCALLLAHELAALSTSLRAGSYLVSLA